MSELTVKMSSWGQVVILAKIRQQLDPKSN